MTVLVIALMQMGTGMADTASSYDLASTTEWRRMDGVWSPNRQTQGQLPASQQNGSVTTDAFADKSSGVLGVTAEAVSTAAMPLPFVEFCSFAPDQSLQPTYDQQFGGFACLHRGVKVGVAKASVKKTFFLGSTPVTYTVTVTVNTDYFEPTASGPTGIIFCQQSQIPASLRSQCDQQLSMAPSQVDGGFGTVGQKSDGSSFVQLNASALFENGSHGDNPGFDFRNTPPGSIEDYPVTRREKWLHPGVTNLVFQINGTGALSIFVELQAQATARGIANAAASCTLDVTAISVAASG